MDSPLRTAPASSPPGEPVVEPSRGAGGWLRRGWQVAWRLLSLLAIWGAILAPAFIPIARMLEPPRSPSPLVQLYVEVVALGTLIAATALMARLVERRPLSTMGLAANGAGRGVLQGLGISIAWLALAIAPASIAGWVSWQRPTGFSSTLLATLIAAVAINAITQEVLLRGYVTHVIEVRFGAHVAAIGSSLLFVLLHFGAIAGEWLAAVNVFAAGMLFALARLEYHSLSVPIGIHIGWNVLLGPFAGTTVSGHTGLAGTWKVLSFHGPRLWTGGAFGLEGGGVVTIATLIVCIAISRSTIRTVVLGDE